MSQAQVAAELRREVAGLRRLTGELATVLDDCIAELEHATPFDCYTRGKKKNCPACEAMKAGRKILDKVPRQ